MSFNIIIIVIIVIVWLVLRWTLPFLRECSMLVSFALSDRHARPMFIGARFDSTVQSQVWCGRPDRRFQSLGKGATLAQRARLWSMDGSVRAMWLKNFRRVVWMMCVSSGWSVGGRTSSLDTWVLQETHSMQRRHRWLNASRFHTSC